MADERKEAIDFVDKKYKFIGEFGRLFGFDTVAASVDAYRKALGKKDFTAEEFAGLTEEQRLAVAQATLDGQRLSYMSKGLGINPDTVGEWTNEFGEGQVSRLFEVNTGLETFDGKPNEKAHLAALQAYASGDVEAITKHAGTMTKALTGGLAARVPLIVRKNGLFPKLKGELSDLVATNYSGLAIDPEKLPDQEAMQLYGLVQQLSEGRGGLEEFAEKYGAKK